MFELWFWVMCVICWLCRLMMKMLKILCLLWLVNVSSGFFGLGLKCGVWLYLFWKVRWCVLLLVVGMRKICGEFWWFDMKVS